MSWMARCYLKDYFCIPFRVVPGIHLAPWWASSGSFKVCKIIHFCEVSFLPVPFPDPTQWDWVWVVIAESTGTSNLHGWSVLLLLWSFVGGGSFLWVFFCHLHTGSYIQNLRCGREARFGAILVVGWRHSPVLWCPLTTVKKHLGYFIVTSFAVLLAATFFNRYVLHAP